MLTIIKKVLGLETDVERPDDRTADHPDRSIVPGPPIASSGAMLSQAKKSETEAALERVASKAE